MVVDAQNKIYVLDGNVPILVQRTTMEETLDIEAKSHIERFHHLFFTLAPDDKYIKYTMEKANSQAESLEQIGKGIEQLSGVVQGNAASSEENTAISVNLAEGAAKMQDRVKIFKLF